MTQENLPLSEAFCLAAELGNKLGASCMEEVWIEKVDEHWVLAINGKKTKTRVDPQFGKLSMGADLEQFHMAVWFNGWLAGILNPFGGTFADGSAANEDTFIEALKNRLAQ